MTPVDATPGPRRRILVVDDHPIYRHGLRCFIDDQPDLVCCGEADSCRSGLEAARHLHPDLIVLDLRLGGDDGMELLRSVLAEQPKMPVLVLSQMSETAGGELALRMGARGYLMKEEATEQVLAAIRALLQDEIYMSRRLSTLVMKRFFRSATEDGISDRLSDRELQIFQLLGSGLGAHEIAERLRISVKTVGTHRENIKVKLGLPDAPSLARSAKDWLHGAAAQPSPDWPAA